MSVIKKFKRQVNGQVREKEVGFNEYLATTEGVLSLKSILCKHYCLDPAHVSITIDTDFRPNRIRTQDGRMADNVFFMEHNGIKLTLLGESAEKFDSLHYLKAGEYATGIENLKVDVILCISDEPDDDLFNRINNGTFHTLPGIDYIFIHTDYWLGDHVTFRLDKEHSTKKMLSRLDKIKNNNNFKISGKSIALRDYLEKNFGFRDKSLNKMDNGKDLYEVRIFDLNHHDKKIKIRYIQNGSKSEIQTSEEEIDQFQDKIRSIFPNLRFVEVDKVYNDNELFIPINDNEEHYKGKLEAYKCFSKIDDIRPFLKANGRKFVSALEGYTQYQGYMRPVYRAGEFVKIYESLRSTKKKKPNVNYPTSKAS
jgi:hypothetical protein